MLKEKIHSSAAPKAIGPYSPAIKINNTVFFSGQIPIDPQTSNLISEDFKQQAVQTLKNLSEMALAAGGDLNKIVKLTIYLTDLATFAVLNECMLEFFNEPYPARTTVQVTALPKQAQIEIDAIMQL